MSRIFAALFALIFLASACAPSSPAVSSPPPAQAGALVGTPAAAADTQALSPTQAALPQGNGTTSPTGQPPAATTAPTAARMRFTETFDQPDDHWSDPLFVTSQAAGHDPLVKFTLESGRMRVSIQDSETYVYRFFKTGLDGGASVQLTYEYRTLNNNGVAVVCRADPEAGTWFEARLIAGESKYNLYRYDRSLKTKSENSLQGEANPYVLLGSGILAAKEFSSARGNTVTLTCTDKTLKLDLNNGLKVITAQSDTSLSGNQAGFGLMSYNNLPVNIDLKTVVIQSSD